MTRNKSRRPAAPLHVVPDAVGDKPSVLAQVGAVNPQTLAPGAAITLSEDDALELFQLNRAIICAQEALDVRVKALAVKCGISLDPADGKWNLNLGTGQFHKLPSEPQE